MKVITRNDQRNRAPSASRPIAAVLFVAFLLPVVGLAPDLPAQVPFPIPVMDQPRQQQEPDALQPGGLLGADPRQALGDRLLEGYKPSDPSQTPLFQGFPTLIPPGFTSFPGGALPSPYRDDADYTPLPPPPALPKSPNAWPTWFHGPGAGAEDGFLPSVGVVAQGSDQVWLRPASGGAFAPLTFYDKFRVIEEGARIQVRGGGQFLIAFQGGASARFDGRAELEVGRLDAETIELSVEELVDVYLMAGERPLRVTVRDTAVLEAERGRVRMQRQGDQLRVANRSSGDLRITPLDTVAGGGSSLRRQDPVEVPPGFAIRLLLHANAFPTPPQLDLVGDVGTETAGRVLRASASGGGGAVRWFGANFRLPPGTSLRLDPLSGSAFPDDPVIDPEDAGRR